MKKAYFDVLSNPCFIWYGFYETMLNAKRLTTNAKNNIKGDQKNYFRFEKLDVWHEARDFVSSFIKALGLKHLSLSN